MIGQWWAVVALMAGWAAIVIWRRGQDNRARRAPPPNDDIDREELEQAERDVKDMQQDVKGRPLEDAVGDDWGPGTPKPPYV